MSGDEIGNQILLLARLLGVLLEHLLEGVVGADTRLHHLRQRAFLGMLGGNLQIAADMMAHQFLDVFRRTYRQVVTQARGNQDALDPRQLPRLAIQPDQRGMVGIQVVADARPDTGWLATGCLDLGALAGQAIHVGSRPTEIGDGPGKARHLVANLFDLVDDRLMGAALDDATFVLGDRAEGATAETAAHDVHREADHVIGRNLRITIGRVRNPCIGQPEYVIHFLGAQGNRRRVEPHIPLAMALHQRPGVTGVGLQVQHAVGVSVQHRVVAYLFIGRQADYRAVALQARMVQQLNHLHVGISRNLGLLALLLLYRTGGGILGVDVGIDDLVDLARTVDPGRVQLEPALGRILANECRATDIGHAGDAFAPAQAMGHFHHRPLGIAVDQDVGLGVDQQRGADLILPVIVMGDAPQRRLDTAEDHWHILVRLTAALAIGQAGPIRALAGLAAGGVGIIGADLAVGSVAVDHRVHVAGGDPEEQVRLAQLHEVVLAVPVRLADHADAKALGLQQPADDRHTEGWVIHIGVTGDDDDVTTVPTQLVHFRTTHRQKGCRSETFGPVAGMIEQRTGRRHAERHYLLLPVTLV